MKMLFKSTEEQFRFRSENHKNNLNWGRQMVVSVDREVLSFKGKF
jgi:hypothetical protein